MELCEVKPCPWNAIPDPLTVLQEAVEWALNGADWCRACGAFPVDQIVVFGRPAHHPGCLIPAAGASVLREEHWYERRWASTHPSRECCWLILRDGIEGACIRPCGHDDGIHEPREDEMR